MEVGAAILHNHSMNMEDWLRGRCAHMTKAGACAGRRGRCDRLSDARRRRRFGHCEICRHGSSACGIGARMGCRHREDQSYGRPHMPVATRARPCQIAYVHDYALIDRVCRIRETRRHPRSPKVRFNPTFLRATRCYQHAGRLPAARFVKPLFGGDHSPHLAGRRSAA